MSQLSMEELRKSLMTPYSNNEISVQNQVNNVQQTIQQSDVVKKDEIQREVIQKEIINNSINSENRSNNIWKVRKYK